MKLLRLTRPLDERKSRLRLALPVANKTAAEVVCGINTLLGVFKDWVQTLTFGNGKEFAKHEEVANILEYETYFAKPYHSGSVARMRTPMDCYANTSLKRWVCWM